MGLLSKHVSDLVASVVAEPKPFVVEVELGEGSGSGGTMVTRPPVRGRRIPTPQVRANATNVIPVGRGNGEQSETLGNDNVNAGFIEVEGDNPMRIFAQVQAKEKCGKTHMCCSMPGPIAVITTDTGTEEVCKKFRRDTGKRFFMKHIEVPREVKGRKLGDGAGTDYEPHWRQVENAVNWVLANKSVRSLFFDTATEIWEIFRMFKFGKLTQVSPQHYGPVNREMSDFFKRIYRERPDLNVIFVSKVKKEYKAMKTKDDTAWNGKYERAGFGDLSYIARMNIELSYVEQVTETGTDGVEVVIEPGKFAARILDCGENPNCIGLRLYSPDLDFVTIALNVFPMSNESDWE